MPSLRVLSRRKISLRGPVLALAVLAIAAILRTAGGQAQPVASPNPAPGAAVVIELKGVIGVAAASFIARGIDQAAKQAAPVVIIRMDTPGGLVSATRDIISAILASPIPVVVYVAPSGARAASAGTYIVYASHVAAMAPGTHIGAATPVSLGGPPGLPEPSQPEKDERPKDQSNEPASAGERKALNDATAYLRSLAQLRGRNPDFAERAVRNAATMTANEALDAKVIELVDGSLDELLADLDGREVTIGGTQRKLATKGVAVEVLAPDWRTQAIAIVTDPNVAYLLLLFGFYGILFEIWNPGFIFPGVAGGICLLLALAALSVLPVSYAGLALIVLGIALMIAEVFVAGTMVLGIGGAIAFVVGSVFLFDPGNVPFRFGIDWPVIAAATLMTIGFMALVLGFAVKARRRPVITGIEQMIGSTGEVVEWSGVRGRIHVHGEMWQARMPVTATPPEKGSRVRIVALDGLTAVIEPVQKTVSARR
jgi:membrane-bound serine protease (ClpP class)